MVFIDTVLHEGANSSLMRLFIFLNGLMTSSPFISFCDYTNTNKGTNSNLLDFICSRGGNCRICARTDSFEVEADISRLSASGLRCNRKVLRNDCRVWFKVFSVILGIGQILKGVVVS